MSLEGKANQLGQMVSANLPMAMQGLVVIPLFAGYDLRLKKGRIFTYDVTGGRFEETDFHATGSGGRDAKNTVKLSYRERLGRDEAVELAVAALYEAADEDTATGGPDPSGGSTPWSRPSTPMDTARLEDAEVAEHFRSVLERRRERGRGRRVLMTMPYYVAPEQVMKDRAEYAQKGIARGRALVGTTYDAGVLIVAENPSSTLHKISEIYDRVAFAGVGRYNEFDQLRVAGVRHADTKGYAYSREDVDARSLANVYAQYLGQVFTHEMKPLEVEILVAELDPVGDAHQLFHIAYDGTVADEQRFTVLGGEADAITHRMAARFRQGWTLGEAVRRVRGEPVRADAHADAPTTSRWRCSNTGLGAGPSGRVGDDELALLLAQVEARLARERGGCGRASLGGRIGPRRRGARGPA